MSAKKRLSKRQGFGDFHEVFQIETEEFVAGRVANDDQICVQSFEQFFESFGELLSSQVVSRPCFDLRIRVFQGFIKNLTCLLSGKNVQNITGCLATCNVRFSDDPCFHFRSGCLINRDMVDRTDQAVMH